MNMRTNKYILNGTLIRWKGLVSLILCVVAAVASAQGCRFDCLNSSLQMGVALYVVNVLLLGSLNVYNLSLIETYCQGDFD